MTIQEKPSKTVISDDELLARATPEAISEALKQIPAATLASALAAEKDSQARAHAVRLLVVEHYGRTRTMISKPTRTNRNNSGSD